MCYLTTGLVRKRYVKSKKRAFNQSRALSDSDNSRLKWQEMVGVLAPNSLAASVLLAFSSTSTPCQQTKCRGEMCVKDLLYVSTACMKSNWKKKILKLNRKSHMQVNHQHNDYDSCCHGYGHMGKKNIVLVYNIY